MRNPMVAFSLFAAAIMTVSGVSNSPSSDSQSLADTLNASDGQPGGGIRMHSRRQAAYVGLSALDRTVPDAIVNNLRPNKRFRLRRADGRSSRLANDRLQTDEMPPPRPPTTSRPAAASGCDNSSDDGSPDQDSVLDVIASGGGVSCSSDVRGGSADDAGPQSAASEDADPALGTSVISTGEDDYTGNGDMSASHYGDVSRAHVGDTPTEYPRYPRRAEGAGGTVKAATSSLSADSPQNGGAVLDDVNSGLQGADGESIQGAAIPGTGTAESPGGAAVSGLVGSSEGGELINSGSGIDNDGGLGGTPGAGGVSESGLARGGQGAS
ncbi:hypothetical protein AcV7_000475 [Taiwanofungus camphoratus]|nr:hypothetical protein AcW2_001054 [Antrodia cinnamomea]KAI0961356.1 hypothetical protein AcV7_000475 [Antrodia cinnamomea]